MIGQCGWADSSPTYFPHISRSGNGFEEAMDGRGQCGVGVGSEIRATIGQVMGDVRPGLDRPVIVAPRRKSVLVVSPIRH